MGVVVGGACKHGDQVELGYEVDFLAAIALSCEKIETLAPDQGSLDAARKLLKPGQWPTLAEDGEGLIWGECQGSGGTPCRNAPRIFGSL